MQEGRTMPKDKPIVNQDPRMRAMVMPLFKFDPNAPEERPFGLGTTFRIDPWGTCATAFHVIEDMLVAAGEKLALRDNVRVVALEIEEILLGAPPLPENAWRTFMGFSAACEITKPPLLHEKPQIRNVTELANVTISRSTRPTPMPFLPVALGGKVPSVGDVVTGYGFAGLDLDTEGEGDERPMEQYLFESSGEITEVIPCDPQSSMPWPRLRVSAEWPGGMSGGPVLNSHGNVIGIISRGWTGEPDSTATHFSGWPVSAATFPTIDPVEAGRYRGFAAIDGNEVAFLGVDRKQVEQFAADNSMSVEFVSCHLESGKWYPC
jgi:trypsin-like peptidase